MPWWCCNASSHRVWHETFECQCQPAEFELLCSALCIPNCLLMLTYELNGSAGTPANVCNATGRHQRHRPRQVSTFILAPNWRLRQSPRSANVYALHNILKHFARNSPIEQIIMKWNCAKSYSRCAMDFCTRKFMIGPLRILEMLNAMRYTLLLYAVLCTTTRKIAK